jgi:hypothetical protein
MARRSDEAQPETLEIIEGVVERVNLQLAAVAGAGVDFADRQAAAEPAPRRSVELAGKLGKRCVVGSRRRFGERPAQHALKQGSSHDHAPLKIMSRVGAVERLIAKREVGEHVAFDHHLQQRPLEPRGIAQVAARHALAIEAQPGEHIATERFSETETFADLAGRHHVDPDRAVRQSPQHLLDQRQACSTSSMRIRRGR